MRESKSKKDGCHCNEPVLSIHKNGYHGGESENTCLSENGNFEMPGRHNLIQRWVTGSSKEVISLHNLCSPPIPNHLKEY